MVKANLEQNYTWKVPEFRVFSGLYFSAFGLNHLSRSDSHLKWYSWKSKQVAFLIFFAENLLSIIYNTIWLLSKLCVQSTNSDSATTSLYTVQYVKEIIFDTITEVVSNFYAFYLCYNISSSPRYFSNGGRFLFFFCHLTSGAFKV